MGILTILNLNDWWKRVTIVEMQIQVVKKEWSVSIDWLVAT